MERVEVSPDGYDGFCVRHLTRFSFMYRGSVWYAVDPDDMTEKVRCFVAVAIKGAYYGME